MVRKIAAILLTVMLLSLSGCSQKEVSVVKIYDVTDSELIEECFENNELVTIVKYYEMNDGKWKTDDYIYQYQVEVTGKMNNAAKDSMFVFLSNTKDITFDQAWKASGLSSNTDDYFKEEETRLVAVKQEAFMRYTS